MKGSNKENFLDLAPKQAKKPSNSGKMPKLPKFKLPNLSKKLIALVLAAVLVLAGAWFFVLRTDGELTNQQVIDKVQSLVGDLPSETPTIATIEDAELSARQDGFYEGSSKGDKVLVYPQSKRAIIYSPDDNKIIKDGSVSVTE